jgi:adenosylmethionine-8-amino-7-oxononanoate aminotransferase
MNRLSSQELIHLDRTAVWHAFSQMAEYDGLIIERGEGCWLTDIHGRRYLDGTSSLWCNLFGHRVPEIDAAVRNQLDQVAHVTNLGMSHPSTITLAKRLIDLAPSNLQHVFFSGDGASAVEVAMKLAFQYWQQCDSPQPKRTRFIALGDAYHGDTIGTVSVSGVSRFQRSFAPLLFDVLRGPCPDAYRRPTGMNEEDACEHYIEAYRGLLEHHAAETVALIVEPLIQGAAGFVCQPKGFMRGIAKLCKEFGVLLIADEVAVGMGRTGRMWALEHDCTKETNIEPDLLCIGKGLTGGYLPMSATLASTPIWNAFLGTHASARTFFHGHTYGGNPLASAAANAVLDLFEHRFAMPFVQQRGELLGNMLEPLRALPMVGDVRRHGMMAAIELVADRDTKRSFAWEDRIGARVCDWTTERGVWLRPLGNVIPILPPLSMGDDDLSLLCETVGKGIRHIQA